MKGEKSVDYHAVLMGVSSLTKKENEENVLFSSTFHMAMGNPFAVISGKKGGIFHATTRLG